MCVILLPCLIIGTQHYSVVICSPTEHFLWVCSSFYCFVSWAVPLWTVDFLKRFSYFNRLPFSKAIRVTSNMNQYNYIKLCTITLRKTAEQNSSIQIQHTIKLHQCNFWVLLSVLVPRIVFDNAKSTQDHSSSYEWTWCLQVVWTTTTIIPDICLCLMGLLKVVIQNTWSMFSLLKDYMYPGWWWGTCSLPDIAGLLSPGPVAMLTDGSWSPMEFGGPQAPHLWSGMRGTSYSL